MSGLLKYGTFIFDRFFMSSPNVTKIAFSPA